MYLHQKFPKEKLKKFVKLEFVDKSSAYDPVNKIPPHKNVDDCSALRQ